MQLQTCDQNADESGSASKLEYIARSHEVYSLTQAKETVMPRRSCDSQGCWMRYRAKTKLALQVLRPVVPPSIVVRDSSRVIVS